MVAVLGIGGFAAAFFHLITHAFFKALLFMASGSVIHGMEHGHHVAHGAHGGHADHAQDEAHGHDAHAAHDDHGHGHAEHAAEHHDEEKFDPQDMRNMGGLIRTMPVTAITFIIGGLALAGAPIITAGFWSKDEILLEAWVTMAHNPIGIVVLVLLSLAAVLTTVYTFRQIALTFLGKPRTEAAIYAQHYNPARGDGRDEAFNSATMTIPLIVLAVFAIFAGFVGVNPSFPIVGPLLSGLGIEKPFINFVKNTLYAEPHFPAFNILPVLLSFAIFGVGVYIGYQLYVRRQYALGQPDPVEGIVGKDVYHMLQNKYYIDEFYQAAFIVPIRRIADGYAKVVDRGIIDSIIHFFARLAGIIGDVVKEFNRVIIDGVGDGIPEAIRDAAQSLRPMQTGRIQQYMLFALLAAIVVGINLIIIAVAPNAVPVLALIQGAIAIILALFFTGSGQRATGSGD